MLLGVAYLLLVIRQHIACWIAAIFSSAIYMFIMVDVGLYMQSALQVFYIAMAVYGWLNWRRDSTDVGPLPVTSWPLIFNLLPLLLIALLGISSGVLLERYSAAAFPYVDSITTWGAIIATWMVARKVLQSWYYWFVVDAVSVYLYINQGLWLTVMLFALYLILIVIGYRAWKATLRSY